MAHKFDPIIPVDDDGLFTRSWANGQKKNIDWLLGYARHIYNCE